MGLRIVPMTEDEKRKIERQRVDDEMNAKKASMRVQASKNPRQRPEKQAYGFNALRGVLGGEYNKPEQIKKGGW